jgi:hypothetical protein
VIDVELDSENYGLIPATTIERELKLFDVIIDLRMRLN